MTDPQPSQLNTEERILAIARLHLAQSSDPYIARFMTECEKQTAAFAELRQQNQQLQALARRLARVAARRQRKLAAVQAANHQLAADLETATDDLEYRARISAEQADKSKRRIAELERLNTELNDLWHTDRERLANLEAFAARESVGGGLGPTLPLTE